MDYAIFNLEYVQGVHIDILLPLESTVRHDPKNFAERLRSLELFIRYLYQKDKEEVKRMLLNNAASDYNGIYGTVLFSCEMIEALERQVQNVGRSMLTGRSRMDKREDIETTLGRWSDLRTGIKEESSNLVEKLRTVEGQV